MNIQEATTKAMEIDGYIVGGLHTDKLFVKPTNTVDRCYLCVDKNHSRRGWQPRASDLISNDWEAVTEEDFLSLSERYSLSSR